MDSSGIALYTILALLVIWGLRKALGSSDDDAPRRGKGTALKNEPISIDVPESTYEMQPTGTFIFDAVGESHYQPALREIAGPETEKDKWHECDAMVLHQLENEHDKNACAVVIEGLLVGYLARPDAKTLVSFMKSKEEPEGFAVKCKAGITGGWISKSGYAGKYGVKLDIDTSEFPALPLHKEMVRFFGKKATNDLTRGEALELRSKFSNEESERFSEWLALEDIIEHLHSEDGKEEFSIKKPSIKAIRDTFLHFRAAGQSTDSIKDDIDEFVEHMIDNNPNLEK